MVQTSVCQLAGFYPLVRSGKKMLWKLYQDNHSHNSGIKLYKRATFPHTSVVLSVNHGQRLKAFDFSLLFCSALEPHQTVVKSNCTVSVEMSRVTYLSCHTRASRSTMQSPKLYLLRHITHKHTDTLRATNRLASGANLCRYVFI